MMPQLLAPFRHRDLLLDFARADFRARHKGSVLGTAWMFVQPILTIVLYLFIYRVAMRPANTDGVPFVLWLLVGLMPWLFLTDAVTAMTPCLLEYKFLVKKVVFEVTLIPGIKLISSAFVAAVVWLAVLIVLSFSGYPPSLGWLQLPYYFVAVLALSIGLGTATSVITPFFRDLGQIVAVCVQFGFWLTPILWPLDQAPAFLVSWLKLNPAMYVIQGMRGALLQDEPFWTHPLLTLYFWVFVSLSNLVGFRIFSKLRPHLADVL